MQKFTLAFIKNISKLISRGSGGIGRHDGLKIHWPLKAVRVRVPPSLPKKPILERGEFLLQGWTIYHETR
jgi:hypothetical protein